MSAPPFIGLTGGVGAGKSEALAALGRLGAATVSSDEVVHELFEDERVRGRLVDRWGPEVAPSDRLDRGRVGAIVFERPEELEWLESALHPLVGERIAAWRAALPGSAALAVVEVPLLFETGMDDLFDGVLCVVAPDEERRRRIEARGVGKAADGSGRQLSQEEKARRATWVVTNDGDLEQLERRLAELLSSMRSAGG